MTLQEAIQILNDPYFLPPTKDYEEKKEAIERVTEWVRAKKTREQDSRD